MTDQPHDRNLEVKLRLEEEIKSKTNALRLVLGAAAALLIVGTVFYHYVEGFSWLNSVWFCVESLSTVGYGDMVPHTAEGKIFTMFFIFAGISVFVRTAQLVSQALGEARARRISRRVARRYARKQSNKA